MSYRDVPPWDTGEEATVSALTRPCLAPEALQGVQWATVCTQGPVQHSHLGTWKGLLLGSTRLVSPLLRPGRSRGSLSTGAEEEGCCQGGPGMGALCPWSLLCTLGELCS